MRISVVRLPQVHGHGGSRFRSATHQYRTREGHFSVCGLVLEKGSSGGRYHAVADEGVPLKEIAAVIGRRLNLPVAGKTPEAAKEHFRWFAVFAGMDMAASSERTRELLGWQPKQPGLIADLDGSSYFESE